MNANVSSGNAFQEDRSKPWSTFSSTRGWITGHLKNGSKLYRKNWDHFLPSLFSSYFPNWFVTFEIRTKTRFQWTNIMLINWNCSPSTKGLFFTASSYTLNWSSTQSNRCSPSYSREWRVRRSICSSMPVFWKKWTWVTTYKNKRIYIG